MVKHVILAHEQGTGSNRSTFIPHILLIVSFFFLMELYSV